jgi:hypothetical protein
MDEEIWQTLSWTPTVVKLGRRRQLGRAVRLALAGLPVAPHQVLFINVLLAFVGKALIVCASVFTGFHSSNVKIRFTYEYLSSTFSLPRFLEEYTSVK